jgi:hypothetical protein
MEFVGDEKRIQAQFCELAIQDQSATPEFEKLWTRAESTNSETVYRFGVPLVVFGLLVVLIAVTGIAVRLRGGATPTVRRAELKVQPETMSLPTAVRPDEKKELVATSPIRSRRANKRRFIATRRGSGPIVMERLEQRVVALSIWQSPTNLFLQSPVTPVFKSLPTLNQSVKELESYLSSKESKESKQ